MIVLRGECVYCGIKELGNCVGVTKLGFWARQEGDTNVRFMRKACNPYLS